MPSTPRDRRDIVEGIAEDVQTLNVDAHRLAKLPHRVAVAQQYTGRPATLFVADHFETPVASLPLARHAIVRIPM